MKKQKQSSSNPNWGGVRVNSGRPKTAIATAVRFDLVCPYCERGFAKDVTAVKGQTLVCSECGQASAVPTSAKSTISDKETNEIKLSVYGQSSFFQEINEEMTTSRLTLDSPVYKVEQILVNWLNMMADNDRQMKIELLNALKMPRSERNNKQRKICVMWYERSSGAKSKVIRQAVNNVFDQFNQGHR